MTQILITGTNSFTGTALRVYLASRPEKYHVETVSLRGSSWENEDFGKFDSVFHVAGLAHDSTKAADKEKYYAINTELAFRTARKAMKDGAHQFIFMSSSIVYGASAPIGHEKIITRDTPLNPESYYGDSKVQAEKRLSELEGKICILRCPMIYGKGCKGNYPLMSKLARRLPVFPKVNNSRSMLYIRNMAEFVRLMIDNEEEGIFWPQNGEYSRTSELVKMIAGVHGRKLILVPGCELPLSVLGKFSGMVNKAFGSLAYDMSLSEYKENYRVCGLPSSIRETEL